MKSELLITTLHPSFNEFWEAYPRKIAKIAAAKAYEKAILNADPETILKALQVQCLQREWMSADQKFIPYPATWLNRGHYLNPNITPTPVSTTAPQLTPIEKQIHSGEYSRILEAMKSIRNSYDPHQSWTLPDKQQYQKLLARRNELRTMLQILI